MNKEKILKIGGEFEINPSSLNGFAEFKPNKDLFLYSSGRCALMAILKNVARTNPKRIHIPYYICHSVVNASTFAGFHVSFYELEKGFLFPLEYLDNIKQGETLLTVRYFGFIDDNPVIESIKESRPDIVTISDHSQSFWTYKQSFAEYSFTSLRKHFPVPDGAFVHTKKRLLNDKASMPTNSFYKPKLLGSIFKWLKNTDKLYLDFFEEGEKMLDDDPDLTQASLVAQVIFENINLELIKQQRKINTQIVYELGKKAGLQFVFDYNKNVIPLNVLVLLKNRDSVRKAMMKQNIFLPIHWPAQEFNSSSQLTNQMADNSLSLIIDQRYGSEDMKFQVNVLSNLIR